MGAQRDLNTGLEGLKRKLLKMAQLVENMIDAAIAELAQRDVGLAAKVPEYERECNRFQIDIDESALSILATQQPVAGDLRFIVAAIKINSELERIGDLTVNITESISHLLRTPPMQAALPREAAAVIPRMAETARQMVRESIQAFVHADVLRAQSVIMTDDQVDAAKKQTLADLLAHITAHSADADAGLSLILISRSLERIADHATNVAQDVIYMIQGRDVRHPKLQKPGTA